ncbi:MAG: hypothetical protein WC914_08585, partial [Proteiniphilum sp.]
KKLKTFMEQQETAPSWGGLFLVPHGRGRNAGLHVPKKTPSNMESVFYTLQRDNYYPFTFAM